jgi:hypothetical protein
MEFNLAPALRDRTEEWAKETTQTISQAALTELRSRKRDMICHLYYNGVKTEEEFNYLNEVGDYVYPAKVRFIPIIRSKIDLQLSKLTRRALNFATIASDSESQKEKMEKKLRYYMDYFDQKVETKRHEMMTNIQTINQKLQEINQILNTQAQSQEDLNMQRELAKMKPELERMLIAARTSSENIALLTEEDEEKIDRYWRYSYNDIRELAAKKYLTKAISEREIQRHSLKAYKDQCITGKPMYFVDTAPGEKFPEFRQISSMYACWSSGSPTGYVQNGGWVTYTIPMSIAEILSRFGDSLDPEHIKRLKDYQSYARESNIKTNFAHAAYFADDNTRVNYSGTTVDKKVDVTYVYWRSPRKVYRKSTPNQYMPGRYFTHIMHEDEILENSIKEGDKLEIRYIDDIYQGILIGSNRDGIVINAGPKPHQVYDVDTFRTEFPIIGYTFGDIDDEPYSYIWATKDLQDLYNILMFQIELLTVLSGVKGIVMDEAQKPDKMSYKEWMYNRKLGVAWIDTMKKKFGRNPSFNQFQTYDDTLSQAVTYIFELARGIDEMAGQIIGVPRQAIGQTISTDQVGTNKMSIDQSALVNEIQFDTHFNLLSKALTRFMNCAAEQGVIDDVISFIANDLTTDDFAVNPDIFKGRKYDIIVSNTDKELNFIEDFKQLAIRERSNNTIALHDLIKVYQGETLKEIEATLEFASKKAIERAESAAMNQMQAEAEKEKQMKELDLRYKQLSDKMSNELKQLELQIKDRELQMKQNMQVQESALKERQAMAENELKSREIELKAAEAQGKVISDDFKNKLESVTKKIDLLLGNRKLDIDEAKLDIERERNQIESKKVDKMNQKSNSNE